MELMRDNINFSSIADFVTSHSTETTLAKAVPVTNLQLCILSVIPIAVIVVSFYLQLGIEKQLLIGAIRCFLQLSALGLILVPIIRKNTPLLVLAYICFMTVIAAFESASRPPYTFDSLPIVCMQSIGITVFIFGTYIFLFVLNTGLDAQYAIPLIGMLLGNSMSAVSVAVSNMVNNLVDKKADVELLLALGATRWEATWEVVRSSMVIGMTPMLNVMTVSGLVTIPGMMTGQIIGGTAPSLAAKYQIIIIYAACGTATVATLTATLLTVRALVDEQYRIRSEKLVHRNSVNRIQSVVNAFQYLMSLFFSRRTRVIQSMTPFLQQNSETQIDINTNSSTQKRPVQTAYGST